VPAINRPSLFWPLLLIGLGVLLLLQTLALLPASLWAALAQLWPLLFIVFGLDLLIGRRSARGAATVLIVGVVLVAGSLTWAAVRASLLPAGAAEPLGQTLQGAARVMTNASPNHRPARPKNERRAPGEAPGALRILQLD